MLRWLFRVLGVTAEDGKTGKRESAWTLVLISIVLTVYFTEKSLITEATALLMMIWGAAIAAIAGAYGLEQMTRIWNEPTNDMGQPLPPGYPRDIAPPGEPYQPEEMR